VDNADLPLPAKLRDSPRGAKTVAAVHGHFTHRHPCVLHTRPKQPVFRKYEKRRDPRVFTQLLHQCIHILLGTALTGIMDKVQNIHRRIILRRARFVKQSAEICARADFSSAPQLHMLAPKCLNILYHLHILKDFISKAPVQTDSACVIL
jgi:hypothetical protein